MADRRSAGFPLPEERGGVLGRRGRRRARGDRSAELPAELVELASAADEAVELAPRPRGSFPRRGREEPDREEPIEPTAPATEATPPAGREVPSSQAAPATPLDLIAGYTEAASGRSRQHALDEAAAGTLDAWAASLTMPAEAPATGAPEVAETAGEAAPAPAPPAPPATPAPRRAQRDPLDDDFLVEDAPPALLEDALIPGSAPPPQEPLEEPVAEPEPAAEPEPVAAVPAPAEPPPAEPEAAFLAPASAEQLPPVPTGVEEQKIPDFVEYRAGEGPRRLLGGAFTVLAVAAVMAIFYGVGHSGAPSLLVAASLTLLALAAWWRLLSWSPTIVSISKGVLEVAQGPHAQRFDLHRSDLRVVVGDDPTSRGWTTEVTRPDGAQATIRRGQVWAAEFSRIVLHHRRAAIAAQLTQRRHSD